MRHNRHSLAGAAVFEGDYYVVLAGLAAEEVDGVIGAVGAGFVAGDESSFVVVEADDGAAAAVADVEAVDVVAAEKDGLAVDGLGLIGIASGEGNHKLLQEDGSVAGFGGAIPDEFFAVALYCRDRQQSNENDKDLPE